MPDPITPAERAAIDAAIAAGRVQHIPMGERAIDPVSTWLIQVQMDMLFLSQGRVPPWEKWTKEVLKDG